MQHWTLPSRLPAPQSTSTATGNPQIPERRPATASELAEGVTRELSLRGSLAVYPRVMAAEHERTVPSPSTDTPANPLAPADAPTGGAESYGPLLLSRHTKEDGRALILYRLPEDGAEPTG